MRQATSNLNVQLYCGDARDCDDGMGGVDLVLTIPYTALPACLIDKPMILSHDLARKDKLESHVGPLTEIGRWNVAQQIKGHGAVQGVWVKGLDPVPVDLGHLCPEMFEPGRGWWPLDLPVRPVDEWLGAT